MEIRREMRPEGGRRTIAKGEGWLGGDCVGSVCRSLSLRWGIPEMCCGGNADVGA